MSRRNTELLLLIASAFPVILLYAMYVLTAGAAISFETLAVPIGLFAAFAAAHIAVRILAPGADPAILPIVSGGHPRSPGQNSLILSAALAGLAVAPPAVEAYSGRPFLWPCLRAAAGSGDPPALCLAAAATRRHMKRKTPATRTCGRFCAPKRYKGRPPMGLPAGISGPKR